MTLQDLARRTYDAYRMTERVNGSVTLVPRDLNDGPELLWEIDATDDRERLWAHDALEQIANLTDDLTGDDAGDLTSRVIDAGWEPADIYTRALWEWAADHQQDVYDATEEIGYPCVGEPLDQTFRYAQTVIAENVLASVSEWLIEQLKEEEA